MAITKGTEKQIAWAEDIRSKALAEHQARIDAAKAKGSDPVKVAQVEAKVARMAAIEDARWWIDNGTLTAGDRLERLDYKYEDRTGTGMAWYPA